MGAYNARTASSGVARCFGDFGAPRQATAAVTLVMFPSRVGAFLPTDLVVEGEEALLDDAALGEGTHPIPVAHPTYAEGGERNVGEMSEPSLTDGTDGNRRRPSGVLWPIHSRCSMEQADNPALHVTQSGNYVVAE